MEAGVSDFWQREAAVPIGMVSIMQQAKLKPCQVVYSLGIFLLRTSVEPDCRWAIWGTTSTPQLPAESLPAWQCSFRANCSGEEAG